MAVIGIHYKDGKSPIDTYESVYIHTINGEFTFDSGNFIKDWFDAKRKYITDLNDTEPYFSHSSSVDHFIMDGAPFESGYLHIVDDKPVLKYVDKTDENYLYSQQEIYEGWEFFVPEGTEPVVPPAP